MKSIDSFLKMKLKRVVDREMLPLPFKKKKTMSVRRQLHLCK
jgi:hypothetical protein